MDRRDLSCPKPLGVKCDMERDSGFSGALILHLFFSLHPSNITAADEQWGVSSPMDVMPQSQVVLLQPVLSNGSNNTPNAAGENARQSRSYAPFKSYPRIAPHPGEHLSKRVGSSRLRGASEYEPQRRPHHRGSSAVSPQPTLQAPLWPMNTYEPVNNPVCDKSPPPLSGASSVPTYTYEFQTAISDIFVSSEKDTSGNDCRKLKRFSNTYNILSKSGLLGITMRTKQLIKENQRTQSQLQQLQEQTGLLLEALSTGQSQLWTKLQVSLQDTLKEPCPDKTPALLL
ncbi:CLOCK-interacting pacemaker a [Eucyclogobius newberryi]|uniref:CLOCK-interacting pacemaker a n=1 Tax=Eucyclogobius newberryi TaxID=166745 RepID=UPI003B593AA0